MLRVLRRKQPKQVSKLFGCVGEVVTDPVSQTRNGTLTKQRHRKTKSTRTCVIIR